MVVIPNLTHGFLSFYNANNDCKKATDHIMSDLARRYHIDGQYSLPSKKKKSHKTKSLTLITNPVFSLSSSTDIIHE
jgi:hypothetical protein